MFGGKLVEPGDLLFKVQLHTQQGECNQFTLDTLSPTELEVMHLTGGTWVHFCNFLPKQIQVKNRTCDGDFVSFQKPVMWSDEQFS